MIYELIIVLWTALSATFGLADDIFLAVGIPLVTAVTIMVLISSILRLFTAKFVGQQINAADERIKANEERRYKESYEHYAASRDRSRAYDARYRKERGIKSRRR